MQSSGGSRVSIQLKMILSFLHDLFVDKYRHHHRRLHRILHARFTLISQLEIDKNQYIVWICAQIVAAFERSSASILRIIINKPDFGWRCFLFIRISYTSQMIFTLPLPMPWKLTIVFQHKTDDWTKLVWHDSSKRNNRKIWNINRK